MARTPLPISFSDSDFWRKIRNSTSGKKVGFFSAALSTGGSVYVVALCDDVRMVPFVRTDEELFETTAIRESLARKLSVVINGPTYGLTGNGKFDALMGSDPVPASETLQEGNIVYKNAVIGGRSSNMYYVSNTPASLPRYKFGRGKAPTNVEAAIGNMGPLIINNLAFGSQNAYNPKQPSAQKKGQPDSKYKIYLKQRSNNRFAANVLLPNSTGKIVIGYNLYYRTVLIILQPHGNIGIAITNLKELLVNIGLDSAVYLDGSDSVLLMIDNEYIIKAASNKNETNITGVGFKY